MKLIAALGNPEPKYEKTRHNVGFEAALAFLRNHAEDFQLDEHEVDFSFLLKNINPRYKAVVVEGIVHTEKVLVVFPMTYMNESGHAVQAVAHYYKVPASEVLIVQDDKDMEFGKIRFVAADKESGSGGHNGVKSIQEMLGTNEIPRLKIGVANDLLERPDADTSDFVLANFTKEEAGNLPEIYQQANEEINSFLG